MKAAPKESRTSVPNTAAPITPAPAAEHTSQFTPRVHGSARELIARFHRVGGSTEIITGSRKSAIVEPSSPADRDAARVRALAAYKDFLTLWKDADPDIPVLKEAKAERAKLQ
jgi:hypothetical protein